MSRMRIANAWVLVVTLGAAVAAQALPGLPPGAEGRGPVPASEMPGQLREVSFDQRLGESLPMDATFRDETGQAVTLGELLDGKPGILALVYYECPMLCTLTLNGLASVLGVLEFDAGREFEVLTVSFDPRETPDLARAKKTNYLQRYGRPGAEDGWHFLTGDEESIRRLTESVGFRYTWDEAARQFAHAAGIVVVTPDGRLARYFYGVEYPPKDLRLGLVEAADGKIGGFVDQLLLYCFHYDPATGRYGAAVMRLVQTGAALMLVVIGVFFLSNWRRGKARRMATVGS